MAIKLFALLSVLITGSVATQCSDSTDSGFRRFVNIEEYKDNLIPFNVFDKGYKGNYVKIGNVSGTLHKDDMTTYQSQYIVRMDLNDNNITTLTTSVFEPLYCLQKLYLRRNKINTIEPDAFKGVNFLRVIALNSNLLKNLPGRVFEHTKVEDLDLSDNTMVAATQGMLGYMNNLVYFNVSHNDITDIDLGQFASTRNLTHFDVSHNDLSHVNFVSGMRLMQLSRVYVAGNRLGVLNMDELKETMPILAYISLQGNPWPCDILYEMIDHLHNVHVAHDVANETETNVEGVDCIGQYSTTSSTAWPTVPTTTTARPTDDELLVEIVVLKRCVVLLVILIVFMVILQVVTTLGLHDWVQIQMWGRPRRRRNEHFRLITRDNERQRLLPIEEEQAFNL